MAILEIKLLDKIVINIKFDQKVAKIKIGEIFCKEDNRINLIQFIPSLILGYQ